MARKYLSKSTFIKGVQCEKALYLHKFYPELADEISQPQEAVFQTGTDVGVLAQKLFSGGVDAGPEDYTKYFASFKYTQQLIDDGVEVIYEAGFCYDYVMCFVDILVKKEGRWYAYEVKSSTKVSDTHVIDASLQYYIMQKSGIDIADISITHIDNTYVRDGELDLQNLFKSQSVLNEAKNNIEYIKNKLKELHTVLADNCIPQADIGSYCNEPYTCNFKGECWKHIPEYSVFDIANLRANKKWNLYYNGYTKLKDIPSETKLSTNQQFEVHSYLTNSKIINHKKIADFVRNLSDNLYYLDFETYNPAIPPFEGLKPYQQTPFQYSAHYENNGLLEHYEFLANPLNDPREPFIKSLINDMKKEGDILVYNIGFEKGRLNALIHSFPEYQNDLQSIIDRMKDLIIPFREKWYYDPVMKGSYSIKDVLPAVVPGFSYDNLEINNGSLASVVFTNLASKNDKVEIQKIRENLLAYCKLDTYAMVKILEVLKSISCS